MPTELKGEALLDYYREATAACYGSDVADYTLLSHRCGWYYISIAFRRVGGGFIQGSRIARRAAKVREMADRLMKRAKEAPQ